MFKKSVAIMALIAGLSATGAEALSLKRGAQPAEQPPSSYKGNTYVDSRGCVYVRAGFGGGTTWVPRVTRNRKVVCGARPSVGGAPSVVATAPKVAPKPVATSAPKPVAPQSTRKPVTKPQTRTVAVAPQRQNVVRPSIPGPALPPRVGFGSSASNTALPPRSAGPKPWLQRQAGLTSGARVQVPTVAPVANLSDLTQTAAGAVPSANAVRSAESTARRVKPSTSVARIVEDKGQSARAVRVNCPAKTGKVAFVRLGGAKLPVRCGPQQVAPVTYVVDDGAGQLIRITTVPHPATREAAEARGLLGGQVTGVRHVASVPTHSVVVAQGAGHAPKRYQVVRRRDLDKSALPPGTVIAPQTYIASNMPVAVPKGYKPAWEDGRLNPMRGVRTLRGDAQMAQLWEEGVPRRLKTLQLPE